MAPGVVILEKMGIDNIKQAAYYPDNQATVYVKSGTRKISPRLGFYRVSLKRSRNIGVSCYQRGHKGRDDEEVAKVANEGIDHDGCFLNAIRLFYRLILFKYAFLGSKYLTNFLLLVFRRAFQQYLISNEMLITVRSNHYYLLRA